MEIDILYILLISFFSNLVVYMIYKYYLMGRISKAMDIVEKYEERLRSVSSPKRREKTYRKVSKQLESYISTVRYYMFIRSMILVGIYILDLFLILMYLSFNIYLPFYIPYLTLKTTTGYLMLNGSLFVFIASYILFTPLSLRSNLKV
ncbi:hypothetical protein BFU36_02590 [Sulfolobus sp. A20]|uniref:hypothetical protein n=2 Tax=Sulfolobaceae TaxID=118883 RepID=UPI000845F3AF|nr:hypothetical protein [Sulfolobus sp. A20]TRM74143.1 hypothetical protein DJ523_05555 [Sulfolobus sp. E5]TRM74949.1 hypothetical protein DJ532_11535 [Sulfolobus sp. A20-N-F8]TRM75211.1 hypothetical protein DJ528_09560 [Sulfolobus sp. B5]TRM87114.1 hypothetical protein DJ529_09510 [Sulfolobus sp. C3]TRM94861.1 hypothetical protein DJ526_01500 [Sulfolobus sp. A20-N-G8]TRN02523.1 hypothetical protein DJ527_03840 [Sulfolobus sp. F1]